MDFIVTPLSFTICTFWSARKIRDARIVKDGLCAQAVIVAVEY